MQPSRPSSQGRQPTPGAAQPSEAPAITLPKGGGAIRGIEETFQANPATGTATFSVPLPVSPARQGFAPRLALAYDSGAGNSAFGLGWDVAIPSIGRKTERRLPEYRDDSDVFQLTGAEDLVPMLEEDGGAWERVESTRTEDGVAYDVRRYRPRIEGAFARVERWLRVSDGDVHWRTATGDNVHSVFGRTAGARIADPADERRVFRWLLEESRDDRGNRIAYAYRAENLDGVGAELLHERNRVSGLAPVANRYLKSVRYGNVTPYRPGEPAPEDFVFETVFDYGEHDADDPRPGDAGEWSLRHDPFSTCRAGFEIRTYRACRRVLLFHRFAQLGGTPCLVSALELEHDDQPGFKFLTGITQTGFIRGGDGTYTRKSLPPLTFTYQAPEWSREVHRVAPGDAVHAPAGLASPRFQWVDLYGEGIAGILTEQTGGWFYKRNLGRGTFEAARPVSPRPSFSGLADGTLAIADVEGDGRQAAVKLDGVPRGFFRAVAEGEWEPFRAFRRVPNRSPASPNARWIDLDGDGRPELVVDEDDAFAWYASEGGDGFAAAHFARKAFDEERGPAVVFADAAQSIFLADFNGDGLADVVRIRNGDIAYWPNLGYGRFGPKVSTTGAPLLDHPERFDPRLVRLADVDGSGTADLVYLGHDAIRVWSNLGGNAWSAAPVTIDPFPPTDAAATDVQVLDFLGEGTACVVWSSARPGEAAAPLRYVDLMAGKKPHVLASYQNNTGKWVDLFYRSSALFWLDDRRAGTPWATRLPFPVHCLRRVESRDLVRGSFFASEYDYHHGYFDHAEREFRGFGRVDQRDTETFGHFVLGGGTNVVEEPLHQPPVLTRSWFHTGAFLDGATVLAHFAHEYYAASEHALPEPELPDGLSALEAREALRACKGMMLRQEVYALDGTPAEPHPYATTQTNCALACLQPRRDRQSAVFLVTPSESISYHYERDPADPRIGHDLVLETDALGNVLRSASVAYPRLAVDAALPAPVRQAQARRTVSCTVSAYTNAIDTPSAYRLPAAFESRGFELTGAAPSAGAFFSAADLRGQLAAAAEIGHEEAPTAGVQRRVLGHGRTYFLADDLATELPLGTQAPLGLVSRTLQLAFTPALLGKLYGGRVTDALLAEGGYVHSEGGADWWLPSGTTVYPADAADHFYLPAGSRDPFGAVQVTVEYDALDLLLTATEDALGNRVEAVNDYRLLGPVRVTDANGSRTAIRADELGMVVASAVMGREGAGEGDTLDDPTVRMEYDLDRWRLQGTPNFVHTFARERHGAANPRWQETYTYSDGGGGVVMTKVQAEPGVARLWNPVLGAVEEVDTTPAVRWVGSGRTILNNKGNPVKQYEPYFSATPGFESEAALVETGITSVLFYDPIGRAVRVERPDGTHSRVELGPWRQAAHDANDTVLASSWYADRGSPAPAAPEPADPEERAAWLAARHAGTPAVSHTDALGRTVYSVADNGAAGVRTSRSETDLTGHESRLFDTLERQVARGLANLAGAPAYAASAEKGERWIFSDAAGRAMRMWDGPERAFRVEYDTLHRPVSTFFLPTGGTEALVGHHVYGEAHPDADTLRLRGRLCRVYDQAGEISIAGFDFKGNPLRVERRLASAHEGTVDWGALDGEPVAALDGLAAPLLEAETWITTATYDALNRPVEARLADGTRVRPAYNEANVLEALEARIRDEGGWITFLETQDYDAKGQRLLADFGNGTRTSYEYESLTWRLARVNTVRTGDAAVLQDLRYTYDPAGNVTERSDGAQQTLFFDNAVVAPRSRFEYDALYQLTRATGREHAGGGQPAHGDPAINPLRHANDAAAVRPYAQSYEYDALGNILRMRHVATGGSWTRHYRYAYQLDPAGLTNRLASTSLPGDDPDGPYSAHYGHDAYGNMDAMPHLASLTWNFADQLHEVDLGGGGTAFYVYGAGGGRIRKAIERPGGRVAERIYLGPVEIYRERQNGVLRLERQTVHVSDNAGRIAQVDTKTVDLDDGAGLGVPVVRYVYGDHLGSATLEADEDGEPVSYEEYHPFGGTSYRSGRSAIEVSLKRYRYIGRERDDETGLYQCGARYYAAWLGRWTAPDPAGFVDGLNLFRYSRNNPVRLRDPNGMQPETAAPGVPPARHQFEMPPHLLREDRRAEAIAHVTGMVFEQNNRMYLVESVRSATFSNGHWSFTGTIRDLGEPLEVTVDASDGTGGAGGEEHPADAGPGAAAGPGPSDGGAPPGGVPDDRTGASPEAPPTGDPAGTGGAGATDSTGGAPGAGAPGSGGGRGAPGGAAPGPGAVSRDGPVDDGLWLIGNAARGADANQTIPRRYTLEPPRGATVTGVRDATLGKVRGTPPRPVGGPAIRFDNPHGSTNYPHINVETLNPDPHIRISPRTLRAAARTARALESVGRVVRPVAIAADVARIGVAIHEDGGLGRNTAVAVSGVAGGWAGAFGGAWLGAKGGALLGGAIGSVVPVLGTAAGAAVGGLLGGLVGGILGAFGGSWAAESAATAVVN
jgi:RHS repeat-associated protein